MEYDEYNDTVDEMKATWNFLSLPNKEETIKGKLLSVYFAAKLIIAIHVSCFLVDEDGPIGVLVMICLKPKVCSATILEDTSAHLPSDKLSFDLSDVIAGPLGVKVLTLSVKFDVSRKKCREGFPL